MNIYRYMRIFYVFEHIDPESFIRSLQESTGSQALNPVTSKLFQRYRFGYWYCDLVRGCDG
jgi:hypothetical protein